MNGIFYQVNGVKAGLSFGMLEQGTIIIIMTRRQLRSVATTLHDDRDPVPSSTPV